MKKLNLMLTVLIVFVVFVSGCTGQSTDTQTGNTEADGTSDTTPSPPATTSLKECFIYTEAWDDWENGRGAICETDADCDEILPELFKTEDPYKCDTTEWVTFTENAGESYSCTTKDDCLEQMKVDAATLEAGLPAAMWATLENYYTTELPKMIRCENSICESTKGLHVARNTVESTEGESDLSGETVITTYTTTICRFGECESAETSMEGYPS